MKNRITFIVFMIFLSFVLTGCWDKVELESRGFAISIGVDKLDKDTEGIAPYPNRYLVTLALPKLDSFTSKGSSDESRILKKNLVVTVPGGMLTANDNVSQRLDYSHSKVIVFGNEVLKDEKLFRETLDGLERIRDINSKIVVMATEGKAEEILSAKSGNEPLVGLFVSDFYDNNSKKTSTTFKQNLEAVLKQLRDNGCAIIPKISVKEDQVSLEGICLIENYTLAGWLTPEETTQCLFMGNDSANLELLTPYKDILLKCRVIKQSTDLKFSENNDKLKMTVNVKVIGEIEEYIFSDEQLFNDNLLKEFGTLYEAEIKKDLEKFLKKLQSEYKGDFFHIEQYVNKKNYELWKKYSEDWGKTYKEMEIEVVSDVNIISLGITK